MPNVKKQKKAPSLGRNIRISDDSYIQLKDFCLEKGYKLGVFCDIAAVERMKSELKK